MDGTIKQNLINVDQLQRKITYRMEQVNYTQACAASYNNGMKEAYLIVLADIKEVEKMSRHGEAAGVLPHLLEIKRRLRTIYWDEDWLEDQIELCIESIGT